MSNPIACRAAEVFKETFGGRPEIVVLAPGRVNLIGEHVDYNDGLVMPMAIDRYIAVAARRTSGDYVRVYSANHARDGVIEIEVGTEMAPAKVERWTNYLRGVLAQYVRRGEVGFGFDAAVVSDLPTGAGLSSSAALEVATAMVVEELGGHPVDPLERAHRCREAEHEFAGVPCGLMDQLSVCYGAEESAMLIDCQSESVRQVRMPGEAGILIVNSMVSHSLSDGQYARRRAECERALEIVGSTSYRELRPSHLSLNTANLDHVLLKRARHVVTEIGRVSEFARALEDGDLGRAGELMYESHRSLRDDFEVSCRELDLLVSIAGLFGGRAGVYGARMTGGGFGGSIVCLTDADGIDAVRAQIVTAYEKATGIQAESFAVRPAAIQVLTTTPMASLENTSIRSSSPS